MAVFGDGTKFGTGAKYGKIVGSQVDGVSSAAAHTSVARPLIGSLTLASSVLSVVPYLQRLLIGHSDGITYCVSTPAVSNRLAGGVSPASAFTGLPCFSGFLTGQITEQAFLGSRSAVFYRVIGGLTPASVLSAAIVKDALVFGPIAAKMSFTPHPQVAYTALGGLAFLGNITAALGLGLQGSGGLHALASFVAAPLLCLGVTSSIQDGSLFLGVADNFCRTDATISGFLRCRSDIDLLRLAGGLIYGSSACRGIPRFAVIGCPGDLVVFLKLSDLHDMIVQEDDYSLRLTLIPE